MGRRRIPAAAAAIVIMLPLLAATPAAAAATPARAVSDCKVEPNAASSQVPWEQQQTQFKDIWRKFHYQGQGVRVAVVDTGLQLDPRQSDQSVKVHPQLQGIRIEPGEDFTNNGQGLSWNNDCDGHGTAVASVIAAQPCSKCRDENNQPIDVPFAGVAPDVTLMPLRILNKRGEDSISNESIGKAIQHAVDEDVDIINVSLETQQPWPAIENAVKAAYEKGIVIVAAAGNNGDTIAYPAAYAADYPNVISVGAIAQDGTIFADSGRKSHATIGAPGVDVTTAQSFFGHKLEKGTSFAAPFVTGVVALMMNRFPDLTPAQIRRRIELTAVRPGLDVPNDQIGYGMIDPIAAVTAILPANAAPQTRIPTGQVIPAIPPPAAPDNRVRNLALLMFGIAAALALATLSFATVYRRGKARNWRPGIARRTTTQP